MVNIIIYIYIYYIFKGFLKFSECKKPLNATLLLCNFATFENN